MWCATGLVDWRIGGSSDTWISEPSANNWASSETNYTHDPCENYHVSAQIGCHTSTPQCTMRLVRAQWWTLVKHKKAAAITLSTSKNKITWSWAPLPLTGNLSEWFFNLGYNDQSTSSSESLKVYQTTQSSRGHNCYWWDWKASCWVWSMWNWYYFDNYSQSPLIPEAPRWWGLPKTSQKSRAPWYWAYNTAYPANFSSATNWSIWTIINNSLSWRSYSMASRFHLGDISLSSARNTSSGMEASCIWQRK